MTETFGLWGWMMNRTLGRAAIALTLMPLAALTGHGEAHAGGYDTPILFTARHQAMGGAAIAYVSDPSAIFHNPAGLRHVGSIDLSVGVGLLLGDITAAPDRPGIDITSGTTVAPVPLLGAGFRLTDFLTAGLAVYPVASAGAKYEYENLGGIQTTDETTLIFLEISPALSLDITKDLSIAFGYRVTFVSLDRVKGAVDDPTFFVFTPSGFNFTGFRLGIQYQPVDELEIGVTYRHKTQTDVSGDSSTLIGKEYGNTEMFFILPAKVGVGLRGNFGDFSPVFDFEYTLQSQNDVTTITPFDKDTGEAASPIQNIQRWEDSITLRAGLEYRVDEFSIRAGYLFDGKVGNLTYPSAFGTPPGPTHTISAGAGYSAEDWEVNFAVVHRNTFGDVVVSPEDTEGRELCLPCSHAGNYQLQLTGIYVDFTYRFGVEDIRGTEWRKGLAN